MTVTLEFQSVKLHIKIFLNAYVSLFLLAVSVEQKKLTKRDLWKEKGRCSLNKYDY